MYFYGSCLGLYYIMTWECMYGVYVMTRMMITIDDVSR